MTDPHTTLLYLVRHGATDANLQKPAVLQGRGMNGSLSAVGRQQAEAAGRFFAGLTVHHVYASPMNRARETAAAIAGPHQHAVQSVDGIVEVDVGRWEGLDWGTIMRNHPDEYAAFMDDPGRNAYLGGESYADVQRRVQPVLQSLLEQHAGESIVVVAHNVVNRVYLAGLLGLDLKYAKGIRQTNTGVNVIRHRRGETELMTLNAHFHLDSIAAT
jgi:broad specificity phosphatase PhoE